MTAPSAMAAVNAPTADNPEKRPKHMQLRPAWENVKQLIMMTLSGRCVRGDTDIPKDAEKAAYWRAIGEGKSEES